VGLLLVQKGKVFAKSSKLEEIKKIEENHVIIGNRTYQTVKKSVPETDLEIVYLYSRTSIYREFVYVIFLSLLIVMSGVFLAFFYYRYHAKKMVNDVQKITEILQYVERGELDKHIKIYDNSEFGKIAEAINHMIDNLKQYIEKEYILVIQQQKAEYSALQSQINPHFLYNTLNGFVALNRMGEKRILERSIVGLSRLFRYTCSRQDISCVKEELNFLEDYLKLEKLKYDERLEYLIWLDEECKEKRIPKLLLQPIVENSIKHGMGNTAQPIMIRISAIYTDVKGIGNVMILTVRDNGVGFHNINTENGNQHIGIDNVRTRAELYCKNVIFQCVSEYGRGTKTTFVFPDEV
ncbi:MAG: sensor histidine kinase, partial [Lachnospiraceae bacterium]